MNDATEYWQAVRDYNKEREYFLEEAKKVSGKLEIRTIKKGMKGLFSNRTFNKGEIILLLKGNYFNKPTRTSIQVGKDKHVENYEGGLINHHCNPSAKIVIHPDFQGANPVSPWEMGLAVLLVAKKDILSGEEITFDYETTETEMAEPFKCYCHGRWIRGKST